MYVNGVNVSAHVQVYDSEFRAHFLQYPPWEYSEFHVRFDSLVPFLRLAFVQRIFSDREVDISTPRACSHKLAGFDYWTRGNIPSTEILC
jgi:hypothetical protein